MILINSSIYDSYEVYFYIIQNQIYTQFMYSISHFSPYVAVFLFFIGVFTSITPCFVSIIPLSIAYINSRNSDSYSTNIFIAGLVTSLLFMICLLHIINYNYVNRIPILSSLVLCIISLNLLQIINFSFFSINTSNLMEKIGTYIPNNIYDYATGCLIGFSSLPCSSSILYIISFWLTHTIHFSIALLYFLSYIIGYIYSLSYILNFTSNSIYNIKYLWDFIIPSSGFLILSISVFNILEKVCY